MISKKVLSLIFFCSISSPVFANTQQPTFYIGLFGGGGTGVSTSANQTGTALYSVSNGGPLAVSANGNSNSYTAGLAGMQLGYYGNAMLFGKNAWRFIPAAEVEGFYLATTPKAQLINVTPRVPGHTFNDSFPMSTGVFLANVILTFKHANTNIVYPYLGGGIGAAVISVTGANSSQINPAEPGINHFNSSSSARSNAFAAQAKVGLGYDVSPHVKLFGEYRYLYLAPTNYTFGSTQYPTHVATTNWNVRVGSMNYNLGVVGIKYVF